MMVREQLIDAETFFEIAHLAENEERRLELEDGVIVDMGSSTRLNTVTGSRINHFLNAWVLPRKLGFVTGADGGYKLAIGRVRRPDTAFMSAARAGALVGVDFDGAPDLAVEVVSPDEDIFKKAREYLNAGARIVWAVYAEEQTVYVMRLDAQGTLTSVPFGINDTLDGGDVLPGFTLPVRDIFD
jgi:Uma2 family endonuclease